MAVKTITIDMDAYRLLSTEKREGESFSKVIKRRLRPASTAVSLLTALPNCTLTEDTLCGIESIVHARRESMPDSTPIAEP